MRGTAMTDHAVKLTGTGLPGATGIEVDGVSVVNGVSHIRVDIDARELPTVVLRLNRIADLGLDLVAKVGLDEDTTAALKALGWTGPDDAEPRSTPTRFADCDEAIDRRGKTWRYSAPGDVWKLVNTEADAPLGPGSVAPHSARSYHKLRAEFGPLTDAGSR